MLFNDELLLPGQSRTTHITLARTDCQPVTPYSSSQSAHIDYRIHQGFTHNEEMLIKSALEIIATRLFRTEILKNMYDICGTSGELLGARVWSHSQLTNNRNYRGMHDLLRFQLMCLKMKHANGQFPIIHVYPMFEKSDTQAEGTVGCLSCISHGLTFSIEGEFQVKLNRYNLDASNNSIENSLYWAGAIVHEMLHNLGHKHRGNDYSNQWQINVFEKCFINNGNYAP